MPKISVIVPVYNAEKSLKRCVDSLLAQIYTDFELLLVDDGSTDRSGVICDEYATLDSRIRTFHKPNGGVSSARNLGLDNARGIWITFADADDYVENNMLKRLIQKITEEKAEIIIANYFEETHKRSIEVQQNLHSLTSHELISDLLQGNLIGSTCNKLFTKRQFVDNNIHFPENIDYCEDLIVVVQLIKLNPKIVFLPEAFYHYDTSSSESITRKYTKQLYKHQKKAAIYLKEILGPEYYEDTLDFTLRVFGMPLGFKIISKQEFKEDYNFSLYSIFKSIRRSYIGRRMKIKILIAKIFGFRFGEKFSKLFINEKNA